MSLITKQIYFDSQNSQNGSLDAPNFSLTDTYKIKGFRVNNICIPTSFSLVNSYNNTFKLITTAGANSVVLPQGNYTATTYNTALTTALPGGFTPTFNSITGKFTITGSQTFSLNFVGTNSHKFLGYPKNTITSSATSQTSSGVVNFSGTDYLLLVSTNLGSKDTGLAGFAGINCLTKVNNSVSAGNIISQYLFDSTFYRADQNLQSFDLVLYDDNFVPISLNGLSWSLTMDFQVEEEL
jgi:hypothetical protein